MSRLEETFGPKGVVNLTQGVGLSSGGYYATQNAIAVWLRHSCDEWVIADGLTKGEVLKELYDFIGGLNDAAAFLEARVD